MEKKYRIHIKDIRIGEQYTFLPSGETKIFEKEDDIAWELINSQNYSAYTSNLDGRKAWDGDSYYEPK